MTQTLRLLSTVALLALPLAAPAQDTAEDAAPDAPAEDAATDDPAADLALGQPVSDEPAIGQPYDREFFGDWSLRCLRTEEGPEPCQLYQLLLDTEGNAVAEFSLFPLPEGSRAAAGATIVAPLETLLTEQLTLSVDGANPRVYPFTFCNLGGCVARVGFTAEEVAEFKAGAAAQLRLVPAAAPDQEVVLTISLSGFTAGYDTTTTPPAE